MTKRQPELSAPFALDAADPDFWTQRLGMVGDFIVELEATGGRRPNGAA